MSVKKLCILKYVKRKTKATCRFFYLASEAWIVCRLLSKGKTELKKIYNFLCDFGIDISLVKKLTNINQCLTDPANRCLTDV